MDKIGGGGGQAYGEEVGGEEGGDFVEEFDGYRTFLGGGLGGLVLVGDVVAGEGGGAVAAEGDAGQARGGAAEGDACVLADEGGFRIVHGGAVEEDGADFGFEEVRVEVELFGQEVVEGDTEGDLEGEALPEEGEEGIELGSAGGKFDG